MARRNRNGKDAPSPEWLAAIEGMQPEPAPAAPEPEKLPPIPKSFCEFLALLLNVVLSPAQRVACLVAFDGVEPCELVDEERELALRMFGNVEVIPTLARQNLLACAGARSGKTYILGALRLLHLALIVPLTRLAPGEIAFAVMVATHVETAGQALRFAEGAARSCGRISALISKDKTRGFTIDREDGSVCIQVFAASTKGASLLGRWYVGAFLDEFAFFRTAADFKVNDAEVLDAVSTRILRGGTPGCQLVVSSTPDVEAGLFHEIYQRNHAHPVDFLALHAPTMLFRGDDPDTRDHVQRAYIVDDVAADANFGANFKKSSENQFFAGWAVDVATSKGDPEPLFTHATAGIDLGFERDSSGIVVTERQGAEVVVTATCLESPTLENPLVPSKVMAKFSLLARRKGCRDMVADKHHWSSALEHANEHDMHLIAGPSVTGEKEEAYLYARQLFREGNIRIPLDPLLVNQLKAVRAKPKPAGGLDIELPRKKGDGHTDLVAALVNALWYDRRHGPIGGSQAAPEAFQGPYQW